VRFRGRWVAKGAAFLGLILGVLALLSFVVMGLWNALIPGLFRGPVLTFWQAAGLLVLSKILFGGLRRGHGWHHGRQHWRGEMWRRKWESMTPEERERLRARFRDRCGGWGGSEEPQSPGEQTKP
jgi:Ca2+/H+ antiporter, TMEM165/GDT1 family